MVDNVAITAGTGTSVAADDIGGIMHQRVKVALGADGSATDAVGGAGAVSAAVQRTTLASDDPAVTALGSLTETAPATDTASSGVNGRLQRIAQRLTSLIALVPTGLGSRAAASSFAVTASTEDIARAGIITETAPASDTASSGQNGRLQRIAQNITAMSAKLPAALGRLAAAASTSVALSTEDKTSLDAVTTAITTNTAPTTAAGTAASAFIGVQGSPSGVPIPVASPGDVVNVTPVLDTSIYASGDTLFTTITTGNIVRANDERALISSLVVIDKDDQKPAFTLHFFSSNVTFGTVNAVPSISDSDAGNYLGSIAVAAADYMDLGGVSVACIKGVNLLIESVSGARNVYIAGVLTAGTPTHTASGIVLRIGALWS